MSNPLEGIEVIHIRQRDGRCTLSLNGQGHLPCLEHKPEPEGWMHHCLIHDVWWPWGVEVCQWCGAHRPKEEVKK